MAEITYATKVDRRTLDVPETEKVTAANMNEIKASVNALYTAINSVKVPTSFAITPSDFTGDVYTDTRLIGKTPVTDFNVWSNNGSGVLLKYTDGYTFNAGTGTLTMPQDDYRIEIYVNLV